MMRTAAAEASASGVQANFTGRLPMLEPGSFTVFIGEDSDTENGAGFILK
jgi:hypothetical protein